MEEKFDLFLLGIVLRIARHWHCSIEFPKKNHSNEQVKWIKLIFPNPTKGLKG